MLSLLSHEEALSHFRCCYFFFLIKVIPAEDF